ncbi:unnamed protein product [marine sediment metagenome]|uniref:Uncharacterized protein n=1 Tax=marine sediment metagenome TaxID=412755 RepID=X0XQ67_9ZZZZ
MVRYTIKDLKKLTSVLYTFFAENYNEWESVLQSLIKKYKTLSYRKMVKVILEDMLVSSCFGIHPESPAYKKIRRLLFLEPLDLMPLYISSEKGWERVISQWRLSIER